MRIHDAWLVDLDGTLYRLPPVKAIMLPITLLGGYRRVRILREFRRTHEHLRHRPLMPDTSPFEQQIRATAESLDLPEAEVEATVRRYMFELPAGFLSRFRRQTLLNEIADFRAAGGRTAIVSDYPAQLKLAGLGALELFDRVVANGESGGPTQLKPSPEGLLLAATALGVEPGRCLVLGDRPSVDGAAARAAGMEFRHIH